MYLREVHAEPDIGALQRFIQSNPLGILITGLPSSNFPTLQCTHIPWVLDLDEESGRIGRLRGHMARQNPHSKALAEAAQASEAGRLEHEVMVLFNGPAHSYVTPRFYAETKPATGKVVPTWDYSAVQVYGKATVHFDSHSPETSSYLQKQVEDLTTQSEETALKHGGATDQSSAWKVSDAPSRYIELLKKAIIGIEIDIERLEGKYKMSQEMSTGDRDGIVQGFEALSTEHGSLMASTVAERGAIKDAKSNK